MAARVRNRGVLGDLGMDPPLSLHRIYMESRWTGSDDVGRYPANGVAFRDLRTFFLGHFGQSGRFARIIITYSLFSHILDLLRSCSLCVRRPAAGAFFQKRPVPLSPSGANIIVA